MAGTTQFTPVASLAGGMLIGLAAALLLITQGKIAGVSGVIGGLLQPRSGDVAWRAWFLGGLAGGGLVLALLWPEAFGVPADRSLITVAMAGLLVGFGTRLGNGCTSGHGVCGISRMAPRSMIATAAFLAAGIAAVTATRLLGGAP
jgi:uncharacterized membrane protein YedE/YeeE